MTSIGETLRRERLKRNLELDQISRDLKISSRLLEAIEEEKFDKLPGGVFTKSFVLQYARALGIDDEEIAGEVQRVLEPASDMPKFAQTPLPPDADIRVPRVETWEAKSNFSWTSPLPALAGVVLVMLLCSLAYAWWQRTRRPVMARDNTPMAAQTTPAPQPGPPVITTPAPPVAETPAPPVDQAHAELPAASIPEAPAALAPQPAGAETPPASPKDGAAPVAEVTQADSNAPVRVQMTAVETVWVSAKTDGKFVFSGTLEPNESRTVAATNNVVLRLGNAGGVNIVLNGKPLGAVGPRGQVRTVQLTSGGFKIVSGKPVPLDPL